MVHAAKYGGASGPIDIHVSVEEGRPVIRVADRGPEFPVEDAERLFDLYYREAGTASSAPGAGIGLFVSSEASARPRSSAAMVSVETARLRTLYVLAFIELGSRRIHLSPSTAHPDSAWVTKQARNLALELDDRSAAIRFLIRDREGKFT